MARGSAPTRVGVVLGAIGVTVLAVAVIALSAIAYQRAHPPAPTQPAAPAPTFSFDASPSQTPVPAPTRPPAPGAAERFLSVGASAAWRGTAGACGQAPPIIEWSDDDGQTWQDVTPTYRGVAQLRALTSFGGVNGTAVADSGESCAIVALSSFTDGEFWEPYDTMLATASYIPAEPGTVVIDGAAIAAPCASPWGLRENGVAALICDGTAFVYADQVWTAMAANVVALTTDATGTVAARLSVACEGLQLTRYGDTTSELGCLSTADASGPIAIDLDGDDILVWAGTTLIRIED